jgi:hypothetical protein
MRRTDGRPLPALAELRLAVRRQKQNSHGVAAGAAGDATLAHCARLSRSQGRAWARPRASLELGTNLLVGAPSRMVYGRRG